MGQKTIQQIVLTNFKKHKELALKINGNSFILAGRNGAGKSSILQAIDHMIRQSEMPEEPLTDGEESGQIEVLLADDGTLYKVRRTFTKKGLGRYELRRDAGNGRFDVLTPAQERFKEIFGNCLDLTPLIHMDGRGQIEFLQAIMESDSAYRNALVENENLIKQYTEERLIIGRQKRDLVAKLNVPEFRALVNYVDEPLVDLAQIAAKRIDTTELIQRINQATATNAMADHYIQTLAAIKVKDENIMGSLAALIQLFEAKKIDIAQTSAELKRAEAHNDAIEADLLEAKKRNEKIEQAKELVNDKKEIDRLSAEWDAYTLKIREAAGMVGRSISRCRFDLIYDGLEMKYTVDDDGKPLEQGLFLRGLPFNRMQQSYGEMLKVIVMLSKALNPDGFNYVSLGDWNLLDEGNQAAVLDIAAQYDIQLGIEKVDNNKIVELQLIEK